MKRVAQSIKDITSSDMMQMVMNRETYVMDITNQLLDHWSYDLYKRKPGPALLENGQLKTTDLDLACFLSALADRKAVIDIPHYKSRRATTKKEGERVVSKDHRHGPVKGLSANKEVFSFSINIKDMNVVITEEDGSETVGSPRNFMLVDVTGKWYEGWSNITFSPTAKENDFLNDKSLWTGNQIFFKNFVHPNRWTSVYGKYYLITKILMERLDEQSKFARKEVKRLLAAGVTFPVTGSGKKKVWPKSSKGADEPIKVDAFQLEVDHSGFVNDFVPYYNTQEGLVQADQDQRTLSYTVIPKLRFATRSSELAFFQAGCKDKGFPAWISEAKWEDGYKQKGKQKVWNRLVLHQVLPGQLGFALRYRTYQKTERVAV